jgi:hypothetical protein
MDVAAVFVGGLGASLLASFLAYYGARRLQDSAIRRRERGAARAVYYEVAQIASDLVIAVMHRLAMPSISTATYDRAAADLAVFLTPSDFDKVAFAYYSVHLCQWHAPVGTADLPDLPVIVERFAAARDVLEHTAFTSEEMAARRLM